MKPADSTNNMAGSLLSADQNNRPVDNAQQTFNGRLVNEVDNTTVRSDKPGVSPWAASFPMSDDKRITAETINPYDPKQIHVSPKHRETHVHVSDTSLLFKIGLELESSKYIFLSKSPLKKGDVLAKTKKYCCGYPITSITVEQQRDASIAAMEIVTSPLTIQQHKELQTERIIKTIKDSLEYFFKGDEDKLITREEIKTIPFCKIIEHINNKIKNDDELNKIEPSAYFESCFDAVILKKDGRTNKKMYTDPYVLADYSEDEILVSELLDTVFSDSLDDTRRDRERLKPLHYRRRQDIWFRQTSFLMPYENIPRLEKLFENYKMVCDKTREITDMTKAWNKLTNKFVLFFQSNKIKIEEIVQSLEVSYTRKFKKNKAEGRSIIKNTIQINYETATYKNEITLMANKNEITPMAKAFLSHYANIFVEYFGRLRHNNKMQVEPGSSKNIIRYNIFSFRVSMHQEIFEILNSPSVEFFKNTIDVIPNFADDFSDFTYQKLKDIHASDGDMTKTDLGFYEPFFKCYLRGVWKDFVECINIRHDNPRCHVYDRAGRESYLHNDKQVFLPHHADDVMLDISAATTSFFVLASQIINNRAFIVLEFRSISAEDFYIPFNKQSKYLQACGQMNTTEYDALIKIFGPEFKDMMEG